jgi:hypothetical protein
LIKWETQVVVEVVEELEELEELKVLFVGCKQIFMGVRAG